MQGERDVERGPLLLHWPIADSSQGLALRGQGARNCNHDPICGSRAEVLSYHLLLLTVCKQDSESEAEEPRLKAGNPVQAVGVLVITIHIGLAVFNCNTSFFPISVFHTKSMQISIFYCIS